MLYFQNTTIEIFRENGWKSRYTQDLKPRYRLERSRNRREKARYKVHSTQYGTKIISHPRLCATRREDYEQYRSTRFAKAHCSSACFMGSCHDIFAKIVSALGIYPKSA